jgi:hypothetical protein
MLNIWASQQWKAAPAGTPAGSYNFVGASSLAGATTIGPVPTFTRTTIGSYIDSSGLLASAAINAPRFDYSFSSPGTPLGMLIEEARTNVCLWNRDLTNAAWVKSNITAALDQIGIDGVASSASSLLATAANGTCLQAITLASSARYQSAYVKRLVGTGTVEMTLNGGSTWVAIVPTASWTRLVIPTATLANPSVGFRLGTNGDKIAVDCVQNENGAFPTSAILTTTVAVQRTADLAIISSTNFSGMWNAATGTLVLGYDIPAGPGNAFAFSVSDNTANNRIVQFTTLGLRPGYRVTSSGVASVSANGVAGSALTVAINKLALAYGTNDFLAYFNSLKSLGSASVVVPTVSQIRFGCAEAGTASFLNGHIRSFQYFPTRLTDTQLASLSS